MPRPLRLLLLLVSVFFATVPALRAHEPLESSASVKRVEESLEVSVVLSPATALRLLPEDSRSRRLLRENFAAYRETFVLAAASVCSLLDAEGAALAPAEVIVTLDDADEVQFLLTYPADARPALLRMAYLDTQPPGAFCLLTDSASNPARHSVLRKARIDHALSTSAAPRS